MLNSHSLSSFTNGCLAAPRRTSSKGPNSSREKLSRNDNHSNMGAEMVEEGLHETPLSQSYPQSPTSTTEMRGIHRSKDELEHLLKDDDEFFSYLQDLKQESKRTLQMLEQLYDTSKLSQFSKSGENINKNTTSVEDNQNNIRHQNVFASFENLQIQDQGNNNYSSDDEDINEIVPKLDAVNQLNVLPDNRSDFRGQPSSFDVINSMWNTFDMSEHRYRIKTPPRQFKVDTWIPKPTIPQPFEMSKREAIIRKRNEKKREKLRLELEKKRQEEENELKKKFKANPLPATTLLPLYDEICMKNDKRRENVRYLSKEILKATEQPFSFVKRDQIRKEIQRSQLLGTNQNDEKYKKGTKFKAKPFPEKLFDLSLADKVAEEDEYRKIRMQMRSEDLLAKSSLPSSMADRVAAKRNTKKKKSKNPRKSFNPAINQDIPDFDLLQQKFEKELKDRRTANTLTVCEPFSLHSGNIPKSMKKDSHSYSDSEKHPTINARKDVKKPKSINSTACMPYSITEATRLRHSATRKKIENKTRLEIEKHSEEFKKEKRRKDLRKQINRKALMNDLSRSIDDQAEEKLRSFQIAERNRQREYRQYLKELEDRVNNRPLLFEQESQTTARKKAEKKYEDVLRQSGIGRDMLHNLMSNSVESVTSENHYSASSSSDDSPNYINNTQTRSDLDDIESDEGNNSVDDYEESISESEP